MTCKDCLHNDVCCRLIKPSEFIIINEQADDCNLFKDKSRFIELPCRVGDVVYEPTSRGTISTYRITRIIYRKHLSYEWELVDGFYSNVVGFLPYRIGKTVFLSREEAEKALKEQVGEK